MTFSQALKAAKTIDLVVGIIDGDFGLAITKVQARKLNDQIRLSDDGNDNETWSLEGDRLVIHIST